MTLEDLKNYLKSSLDPKLHVLLEQPDGGFRLAEALKASIPPMDALEGEPGFVLWHRAGVYYQELKRIQEALAVYSSLYDHLLKAQEDLGKQVHKGTPLVRMSDCYLLLGYRVLAKRYLMLTTCEDAIRDQGVIRPDAGVFFRMVWNLNLAPDALRRYGSEIWQLHKDHPVESRFPEWILQELDQEWCSELPSVEEAGIYLTTSRYVTSLLGFVGDSTGKGLERLAHYVLQCIPGCRAYRRQVSKSTDYDVVCSFEGLDVDFRSELGRYIICECKDWNRPADFTSIAKFFRVLQSAKCRFGILFSREGISGSETDKHAAREILKVFQDTGQVVIVVTEPDLKRVGAGANFISMMRLKYERVRLDLEA